MSRFCASTAASASALSEAADASAADLADDNALEAFIRKTVTGIWHASCTCRMGSPDGPLEVTEELGRVRGVEGLRVVDASIMPEVPACNTNIPTIMIAEKMADAIVAN